MTLDQLEVYLADGARQEVIAASLVFIHGFDDDQAEAWINEHLQEKPGRYAPIAQ